MKLDRLNMAGVAQAAGVSVMTVSRVLRGSPNVAPETRAKVEEVVRSTGYRPNPLVSTLMAQVHGQRRDSSAATIAWLSPYSRTEAWPKDNETTPRMFRGAQTRAEQLGFKIEVFHLREPGMSMKRIEKILHARGICGVLVAPGRGPGHHFSMNMNHFAAASVGYSIWRPPLHQAANHHFLTMLTAIRKLTRRGYCKIGLYLTDITDKGSFHTFTSAFAFYQNSRKARFRVPVLMKARWNRSEFQGWVTTHKPDAVLSTHYPALEWLKEMGLALPQDVGFAHLDRQPSMAPCSGIDQLHEEAGEAAVEIVASQIYNHTFGTPARSRILMIEGRWIDDGTTRPLPVERTRRIP